MIGNIFKRKVEYVDVNDVLNTEADTKLGAMDKFIKELTEASDSAKDLMEVTQEKIADLNIIVSKCKKVRKLAGNMLK